MSDQLRVETPTIPETGGWRGHTGLLFGCAQALDGEHQQPQYSTWRCPHIDGPRFEVGRIAWERLDRHLLESFGWVSQHRHRFVRAIDMYEEIRSFPSDTVALLNGPRAGEKVPSAGSYEVRLPIAAQPTYDFSERHGEPLLSPEWGEYRYNVVRFNGEALGVYAGRT